MPSKSPFLYFSNEYDTKEQTEKKKQKTRRSLVELWYIMWLYTTYVLHRHHNITTTVNGQVFDWFLVLYLDFLRVHPFWRNFFLFLSSQLNLIGAVSRVGITISQYICIFSLNIQTNLIKNITLNSKSPNRIKKLTLLLLIKECTDFNLMVRALSAF